MTLPILLKKEFSLQEFQVNNILALFESGATIPFMARYRKEATNSLDEIELRNIRERYDYYNELFARRETVLKTIEAQGKLTEELKKKIETCLEKNALEDIYLPYKPKKKTRATKARESGLEPLCTSILSLTDANADLAALAAPFISTEKGVPDAEAALSGAADIFAEQVAETAAHRDFVRTTYVEKGAFVSHVRKAYEGKKTKFEMYYDFKAPVKGMASHTVLALRRAEKEEVILFDIEADDDAIVSRLTRDAVSVGPGPVQAFLAGAVKDGYERLMKASLTAEVRIDKKHEADREAIRVFETNLRELLLSPPAGQVAVLGLDPGFRSGCKLAAISETGKFLEYATIFPHEPQKDEAGAAKTLLKFTRAHHPKYITIGNGTASRESERFAKLALKALPGETSPKVLLVSESGASVYSASECAIREFPDLDLTIRSAVSIARRFQDPLSELVKIEPKSIGVGQYQHDVDQTLLKKKLDEVVESCVNYVGVDVNCASAELLTYVSGLNRAVAENIVKHRDKNGPFRDRNALSDVPRLGDKAFEQCAGFLRIKGGGNPLDDSAVHPESYYIVEKMAKNLGLPVAALIRNSEVLDKIDAKAFTDEKTGVVTVKDIVEELKKPGRDPRSQFAYAEFREDVSEISHLKEGMVLEGCVTNVAAFGAFVDIGVHQDGLVHVSKMAERYVKDPNEVVKVGQIVKVKVVGVDEALKRISLSMRLNEAPAKPAPQENPGRGRDDRKGPAPAKPGPQPRPAVPQKKPASIHDLIKKFQG
ncbi:MAG: Tex family protein [Fibrobacterota bacterium]